MSRRPGDAFDIAFVAALWVVAATRGFDAFAVDELVDRVWRLHHGVAPPS
jgi:hypothetical protein